MRTIYPADERGGKALLSGRLSKTYNGLISKTRLLVPANPYENTTEESASEFSNREIPMNPEVDLNLQTSKWLDGGGI